MVPLAVPPTVAVKFVVRGAAPLAGLTFRVAESVSPPVPVTVTALALVFELSKTSSLESRTPFSLTSNQSAT